MKVWKKMALPAMALVMLLVSVGPAGRASAVPSVPKKESRYFVAGDRWWYPLKGITSKSAVSKLTSSDKTVMEAELVKSGRNVYMIAVPKKTGTATIRMKVRYQKKSYTLKTRLTAKKYENPLSVLKFGKQDLTKKFDASSRYSMGITRTLRNQKLYVRLKKGWSLSHITVFDDKTSQSYENKDKITIKKGQTLNIWIKDAEGVGFNLVLY